MTLKEYFDLTSTKPANLAKRLGVSTSTITRLRDRDRKPSAGLAMRIEQETKGAVTFRDLVGHAA